MSAVARRSNEERGPGAAQHRSCRTFSEAAKVRGKGGRFSTVRVGGQRTGRRQLRKPGGQEREEPVGRAGRAQQPVEVSRSIFSLIWLPPAGRPLSLSRPTLRISAPPRFSGTFGPSPITTSSSPSSSETATTSRRRRCQCPSSFAGGLPR